MKRTILITVCLYSAMILQASPSSTTISVVSTAGGLTSAISTAGVDPIYVINLKVTGVIDARDFKAMRDDMFNLRDIDLSGASIAAYTGADGTYPDNVYYYPNNIPSYAFNNLYYLNSLVLPNTLNDFSIQSLSNCINLKSISIPASLHYMTCYESSHRFPNGCSVIVDPANSNYSNLEDVLFNKLKTDIYFCPTTKTGVYYIPPTVTYIYPETFYGCSNLTAVTIPNGVDQISYRAFYGCTSLNQVIIPSSVSYIGYSAFGNTSGDVTVDPANFYFASERGVLFNKDKTYLIHCPIDKSGNYIMPTSVKHIVDSAFYNCRSLTSVTIPSSVDYIGVRAFYNCNGLKSIYSNSIIPVDLSLSDSVFVGVNKTTCTLHVPVGSKAAYELANQWKDFTIVEDAVMAVKNSKTTNSKAIVQNGQLKVTGLDANEQVAVYNLQGIQLINQAAGADNISLTLPAHGVYVVCVGKQSMKVVY